MNKRNLILATIATGACLFCTSGAKAQNLIVNGDFSSGLTGWIVATNNTTTYETTITYDVGVGNPAGSALLDRVDTTLADNSDYLYQVVPVMPGQSYQFNADWAGDLLNGGTGRNWAEVMIAFVPNAGSPTFTIQYKKATVGGPNAPTTPWDWESVLASPSDTSSPTNGVFTATDNYMVVAFNLGGRAGTGVGYYHADNVSVTPYPPTTVPIFTNVMRSGTNLVLQGRNGPVNGGYQMLRSTNLIVPAGNWPGIGIKTFDENGNFNFTDAPPAEDPCNFYRLLVISSLPVSAPEITAQPQNLAIGAGNDANFSVTATGTGPLTYWWYFDTNTLLDAGPASTLNIPNAQINDSGKISVTVSNGYGVVNSVFATLTVTNSTEPPIIITQPTNAISAIVGQSVNFSVTAAGADPLHYQWCYNTNTVLTGQTNTALTLSDVQLTKAGNYSVIVTNLFGATNSLFATLTVSDNPTPELIGWASVSGYGETTTTGGGNAVPILAADIAQLKSLASDGTPRVIQLSGTYITGNSPVSINNNKTLVGLGPDAIIQGGIDINTRSNIIIRNLSILGNGQFSTTNSDGTEIQPVDAAAARASHHLWFDHLNIADGPDGNLDLTVGSDLVTVSWCKFWYTTAGRAHRLSNLIGNGSTATTDTNKNNVTYHHNWFSTNVDQRMPRLLFGKGHMFNSYYSCTGNSYCIGTGSWGSALIENNYFQQVKNPHQAQDGNPSYIAASGNVYNGCTGNTQTGLLNPDYDGNDPGPWIPPYSYTLDPAANVPAMVMQGAGPQ
jgi:pectate lyase